LNDKYTASKNAPDPRYVTVVAEE